MFAASRGPPSDPQQSAGCGIFATDLWLDMHKAWLRFDGILVSPAQRCSCHNTKAAAENMTLYTKRMGS